MFENTKNFKVKLYQTETIKKPKLSPNSESNKTELTMRKSENGNSFIKKQFVPSCYNVQTNDMDVPKWVVFGTLSYSELNISEKSNLSFWPVTISEMLVHSVQCVKIWFENAHPSN